MKICNQHDVAYTGRECPACEAEDKLAEAEATINDLNEQIEQLADEIASLNCAG